MAWLPEWLEAILLFLLHAWALAALRRFWAGFSSPLGALGKSVQSAGLDGMSFLALETCEASALWTGLALYAALVTAGGAVLLAA